MALYFADLNATDINTDYAYAVACKQVVGLEEDFVYIAKMQFDFDRKCVWQQVPHQSTSQSAEYSTTGVPTQECNSMATQSHA